MNIHILGLVFILTSCAGQHKKINGVSFVASNAAIENKNVQPVLNINGNFVALMPFGFIRDLKTPEVQYNTSRQWFGETKKGLEHYAKEFKNSNVKIMVKPHLWVSRGLFTGLIEMDSESKFRMRRSIFLF